MSGEELQIRMKTNHSTDNICDEDYHLDGNNSTESFQIGNSGKYNIPAQKSTDPRTSVDFILNHPQDAHRRRRISRESLLYKESGLGRDLFIPKEPPSAVTSSPIYTYHKQFSINALDSQKFATPVMGGSDIPPSILQLKGEPINDFNIINNESGPNPQADGPTMHSAIGRAENESLELLSAVAAAKESESRDDLGNKEIPSSGSSDLKIAPCIDRSTEDPNKYAKPQSIGYETTGFPDDISGVEIEADFARKSGKLKQAESRITHLMSPVEADLHVFSGESNSEDEGESLESLLKSHKVGIRSNKNKILRPEHQFQFHGEVFVSKKLAPKRSRKELDSNSLNIKFLKKNAFQEQKAVSAVVTPALPSGYPKYIVQKDGGYYSPNFDTSEDFKRRNCWKLTELRCDDDVWYFRDEMDYRIFPFFNPEENRPTQSDREFWLISVLENCLNQDALHVMLQRGLVQWIIATIGTSTKDTERMILLLILRMAASCYNYADLLLYGCEHAYSFILEVLRSSNDHFDSVVFRRKLMDSRAYTFFLTVAWLAHLRPILPSSRYRSIDDEAKYKLVRDVFITRYNPLLNGSIKNYQDFFPPLLASQHAKLTTHDMAIEIFVDMAKFCLTDRFAESIMSVRWAKVFSNYLANDPGSLLSIQLSDVLHRSPEVGIKLVDPFIVGINCFKCLDWVQSQVLEREYFESTSSPMPFVPLRYTRACLDALLSMSTSMSEDLLDDEENSNNDFLKFIMSGKPIIKLVQYALIAPKLQEEWYRNLYEDIWVLIHKLNYSFPYLLRTLIDIATHDEDEYDDIPLELRGHAALYIATSTIFSSKPKLTRVEMLKVRHSLQLFAEHAHSTEIRANLLELALQLSIYLEPRNYGITSSMTHDGEVQFVAYEFEKETNTDRDSIFSDCRKIYISSSRLFEENKTVEVKRVLPSFITNDCGASSSIAKNKANK